MNALVLGCTGLHLALLNKSQSKVQRLVLSNKEAIFERNAVGQTALHLAADWPWAIALLLKNGADLTAKDKMGVIPLGYAYAFIAPGTAELLMEYGSPLSYGDHLTGEWCTVLREIPVSSDGETLHKMHELFAVEVASRRRKLLTHARENLPVSIFDKVATGLNATDRLPDLEAYDIIQALSEIGDGVDVHYWFMTAGSVYSTESTTLDLAETFFEHGFRNLESTNLYGTTPLTSICQQSYYDQEDFLSMLPWLHQNGASFTRPLHLPRLTRYKIPSVNVIAQSLCHQYFRLCGFTFSWPVNDEMIKPIELILGTCFEENRDLCVCLCSPKGCTPSTMFLKGLQASVSGPNDNTIDYVLHVLYGDQKLLRESSFDQAALRIKLFYALEIRHTCCRVHSKRIEPPIDDDDAKEIWAEDKHLYKLFAELLPKAQEKWSKSSLSFSDFWASFYRDHIRPGRYANTSEDYIQRVRDLGVQVEDPGDESSYERHTSHDDTSRESSDHKDTGKDDSEGEYSDQEYSDQDVVDD